MIGALIYFLILLVVLAVVAAAVHYVLQRMPLDPGMKQIVSLVLGAVLLIVLLLAALRLFGGLI